VHLIAIGPGPRGRRSGSRGRSRTSESWGSTTGTTPRRAWRGSRSRSARTPPSRCSRCAGGSRCRRSPSTSGCRASRPQPSIAGMRPRRASRPRDPSACHRAARSHEPVAVDRGLACAEPRREGRLAGRLVVRRLASVAVLLRIVGERGPPDHDSHHRAGPNWPTTPRDDLRVVLDVCEREADDALGVLVGSACRTLVAHVGCIVGED
jgi:hypothetical protein